MHPGLPAATTRPAARFSPSGPAAASPARPGVPPASGTICSWKRGGPAGRAANVQLPPPQARRTARLLFRRATAAPPADLA